jgi:hypothetical protein
MKHNRLYQGVLLFKSVLAELEGEMMKELKLFWLD